MGDTTKGVGIWHEIRLQGAYKPGGGFITPGQPELGIALTCPQGDLFRTTPFPEIRGNFDKSLP